MSAGSIKLSRRLGLPPESICKGVSEKQEVTEQMLSIIDNTSHPLQHTVLRQQSCDSFSSAVEKRDKKTTLFTSFSLLSNNSPKCDR